MSKKFQIQEGNFPYIKLTDWYTEIERENRILYEKMLNLYSNLKAPDNKGKYPYNNLKYRRPKIFEQEAVGSK